METWKKNKIVETYYMLNEHDKNKVKLKRVTVKNPMAVDIWFYHARHRNINHLQAMLDEKIVDINIKDKLTEDTLSHFAVQQRSLVLIDFCLRNKANFNVKSGDNETVFCETCYRHVGINVFKKVWETISPNELTKHLFDVDCVDNSLINRLCSFDKNIKKILWLEKKFPTQWNELKSNNKIWLDLIDKAKEQEANEIFLYLKGLQNLKNDLEINLPKNNNIKRKMKL